MMAGTAKARSTSKRGEVAPFLAMDVMREAKAMAAAGADVLHLEVGQPGLEVDLAFAVPAII